MHMPHTNVDVVCITKPAKPTQRKSYTRMKLHLLIFKYDDAYGNVWHAFSRALLTVIFFSFRMSLKSSFLAFQKVVQIGGTEVIWSKI